MAGTETSQRINNTLGLKILAGGAVARAQSCVGDARPFQPALVREREQLVGDFAAWLPPDFDDRDDVVPGWMCNEPRVCSR